VVVPAGLSAGASFYGCTASDLVAPPDCRYTQNGKRLYLHVFSWPFKHLHLAGLAGRIEYAQFLNDASEVRFTEYERNVRTHHLSVAGEAGSVVLDLPVLKPSAVVPVVEIFLK
jgi:alpha-L-fucosidase